MDIPENILTAMDILQSNGFECYIVGGCVRDSLMGQTPHDYDLTTSALPDEMLEVFKDYRIIETGIKHGTVTVVINNENIEITTYRIDGEYADNRHPESVEFTDELSEDLSRRDFTVNAMAYSKKTGLIDLFGGAEDLKNNIIRSVGDPDLRFNEDGLRILRALRFASALGFSIEEKTSLSIHKNRQLLRNISRERIYIEFTKLLCGQNPSDMVRLYHDVLSEFISCPESCDELLGTRPDKMLRYSIFLRKAENPKEDLLALHADNLTVKTVSWVCERIDDEIVTDVDIKLLLQSGGVENALLLAEAKKAFGQDTSALVSKIMILKDECYCVKQLAVSGSDLLKIGAKQGKDMGKLLSAILDAVISGRIKNNRDELLIFAKSMLDNSPNA